MGKLTFKTKPTSNQLSFKDTHDSQYYYDKKEWRKLRKQYYEEHPLCEECLKEGNYKPANDIHHKIHFMSGKTETQRIRLLLDYNNLMALCKYHHLQVHFGEEPKLSDY